jgi:hypothetical protein
VSTDIQRCQAWLVPEWKTLFIIIIYLFIFCSHLYLSVGLTLALGPKSGGLLEKYRGEPPANILLNESLPPPCVHRTRRFTRYAGTAYLLRALFGSESLIFAKVVTRKIKLGVHELECQKPFSITFCDA